MKPEGGLTSTPCLLHWTPLHSLSEKVFVRFVQYNTGYSQLQL